jgi:hypothetical protein
MRKRAISRAVWRAMLVLGLTCGEAVVMRAQEVTPPTSAENAGDPAQQAGAPDVSQTDKPLSDADAGRQQVREQEHQRMLVVLPTFEMTNNQNAPPLTVAQKFHVAFRGAVDPAAFVTAALNGAVGQATDSFPGYGQGAQGFGKRVGAAYVDSFNGTMLSNGLFPSLMAQDPRYFRMGSGSIGKRFLHALQGVVWTKKDKGGWGPNYANIAGNLAAGGIANLYYPSSDRGVGLTVERAFTVMAEGGLGLIGVEFWPDISRKYLHGHGGVKALPPPEDPKKPPCQ